MILCCQTRVATRYFVLKGTQLSYYKDEDADVPKGTIQLCFQSTKSCLEKTSETAFRVVTDDGGKLTAQSFDEARATVQ